VTTGEVGAEEEEWFDIPAGENSPGDSLGDKCLETQNAMM